MTWILVWGLLVVVFAKAKSESSFDNGFVKDMNPIIEEEVKKEGDECNANSFTKILCENDKLKFCGPSNQIMSVPCVINGRQGFCNCEKTACVREKPICPGEKNKCYEPNTKLPDNQDCHKFSYCDENNEKITLTCPVKLIYDPKEQKCKDQNSARCNKIVCPRPGNTLQLIPFPQAKNYYVLCYKGIGDVRKCSDKYYTVRNNRCQFDCSLTNASGMFKETNLERCQKGIYYACRKAGTSFTTIQVNCKEGLTFDEKLGLCTEKNTCVEPEKAL